MHIEEYIEKITNCVQCGRAATEALRKTSHLIKARSIAYGASFCIFAARLAEAMGARGFFQSILPGKGSLVHQILALAFPSIVCNNWQRILSGKISRQNVLTSIKNAIKTLEQKGIPSMEEANEETISAAVSDATVMLGDAINLLRQIAPRLGMKNHSHVNVYSEIQLMSYRLHIWGVLDALIENPESKTAIIIEWKTSAGDETPTIYQWEIAQVHAYALLEADRLGYDDLKAPILTGKIVPVIIRPKGRTRCYSLSPIFKSSNRGIDLNDLLRKIILTAEHLTLTISNIRSFVDPNIRTLCKVKINLPNGKTKTVEAFRRIPDDLPRGNPRKEYLTWPCRACSLIEECRFYSSFEDRDFIDKIAWRTRYAIYNYRENALKPYKELHRITSEWNVNPNLLKERRLHTLQESGNRIDIFDKAAILDEQIILTRRIRDEEANQYRPLTVRTGRPVLVIFNESHIKDILLRLSFFGRVDEISFETYLLKVSIGPTNQASKLQLEILKNYATAHPEVTNCIVAVEGNVDLTQLELRAVDAYQRATKKAKELKKNKKITDENELRELIDLAQALKSKGEKIFEENLAQLFGTPLY